MKTDPDETRPYDDENFKFDPKYNWFTFSKKFMTSKRNY